MCKIGKKNSLKNGGKVGTLDQGRYIRTCKITPTQSLENQVLEYQGGRTLDSNAHAARESISLFREVTEGLVFNRWKLVSFLVFNIKAIYLVYLLRSANQKMISKPSLLFQFNFLHC